MIICIIIIINMHIDSEHFREEKRLPSHVMYGKKRELWSPIDISIYFEYHVKFISHVLIVLTCIHISEF